MSRYWFKPRRYGLGATPSSWEGWALLAAYVVALAGLGQVFGLSLQAGEMRPLWFVLAVGALTAVLVVVCWRKTEGSWRWRWGQD